MEQNQAYGFVQQNSTSQSPAAENTYELVDIQATNRKYVRKEESPIVVQQKSRARRSPIVCVAIGIVATTAVLALVVAIVAVVLNPVLNSSQQVESLEMEVERLQLSLNETVKEIRVTIRQHTELLHKLTLGSIINPARSCSEILPVHSVSGEYWIQTSNTPVQVYCDMNRTCCNSTGGWTRVANLDMTDPSQQCPTGFTLENRTTAPLRTCAGPGAGCVSTIFSSHGIEYSNVCGRVLGYQEGATTAFYPYYMNSSITIDDNYFAGVSLTHGQSPRQHIWSFAAAVDEDRTNFHIASCPCSRTDLTYDGSIPPFIGQDYFCETGARGIWETGRFYFEDPLWDGQGCGTISSCCSFNNPPWFCKQLPQPTTDNIELRLCYATDSVRKDIPLEQAEIYIK